MHVNCISAWSASIDSKLVDFEGSSCQRKIIFLRGQVEVL